MEIRIGELRHKLVLEDVVRVDDGSGGAIETWQQQAELWAALRPLQGIERDDADQLSGRVSHEIWIRYRTNVWPQMRFRSGDRIFEIRAVVNVGERRRFLKCLAEERDL
jgi:SPP1 family predicted phage head-tail adaptor